MNSNHGNRPAAVVCAVVAVLSSSVGRADEVLYWNNIAMEVMKETATTPPRASRDLAIVQTAVYDAVNAIDPTHDPILYGPTVVGPASQESAVAAATYWALVGLHPEYAAGLDSTFAERLATIPDGPAKNNGIALGQDVAGHILALRASDGSDAGFDYRGGTAVGQWRPALPDYACAEDPHWGSVTPFVMAGSDAFLPGGPPALNSAEYAAAVNEVKRLGGADSTARTADQTQMALFWLDVPGDTASPVGKWNQVAQALGEQQGNTLPDNARMLALMNLAMADAAIVAWDAKYTYELWRPEDAIHLADTDGNPDTLADPDWMPLFESPAFPEYVSGHSTFGGAAAEVLALFFGSDEIPFEMEAGYGVMPGVTRTYDSIYEAMIENGISRVYAGVHFQFSNIDGLETGQAIGQYVFRQAAQPIPAPAASTLVLIGAACLLRRNHRPRR